MSTNETSEALPIHFFTIVLNGEPFVRHHVEQFKKLSCRWHWHIVEGVAELKHDTGWSLATGGSIPPNHREGRSVDGTTEYLDALAKEYPSNVSVYRKRPNQFWDGKREMINAPLANIREECLLWEVDVDELWTAGQIETVRGLFLAHPEKTAALYRCHYFVGPNLVTRTYGTYGNHANEWLRTWRYRPGMRWAKHEPPVLAENMGNNQWRDVAHTPFLQDETETAGLAFQHFAYATEQQLQFKESYYGYAGAVHRWRRLQNAESYPVKLRDYFHWVRDETVVDRSEAFVPSPLIELPAAPKMGAVREIIWMRTDGVGDGVLSSAMLPLIAKEYPGARITVVCREYAAGLYEKCPHVQEIITVNHRRGIEDEQYRLDFILRLRSLQAEKCLYSAYSREGLGDFLTVNSGAKEMVAMDGDFCNLKESARRELDQHYTRLIDSPGQWKPELARYGDFLRGMGIECETLKPEMWTSEEDRSAAAAIFAKSGFEPEKTIALFAAALWNFKAYPSFGQALATICRERSLKLIGLGSNEEYAFNEKCLEEIGAPHLNLSGKVTLREGAEIIRKSRLAVGVDTGRAHIACAMGTPNVVVLGGGQMGRFFPYSPLTSAVSFPMACYGCNWKCKHEHSHCVKDIRPEVLELAIREALDSRSLRPRLYLQHHGFGGLPPATLPHFNPDILPAMVLDVTYVAPEGEPVFQLQPPSFSGNLLRVVQIPRRAAPVPAVMQVHGKTTGGSMVISFGQKRD